MPKIAFFRQLPISTPFDNIPQNSGDFRKNTAYNSIKYRIMYYESTNKYVIFRPKRIAPEFFLCYNKRTEKNNKERENGKSESAGSRQQQ